MVRTRTSAFLEQLLANVVITALAGKYGSIWNQIIAEHANAQVGLLKVIMMLPFHNLVEMSRYRCLEN